MLPPWTPRRSCKMLVSLGAEIEAVVPEEPSLEEVYLRLLRDQGSETA